MGIIREEIHHEELEVKITVVEKKKMVKLLSLGDFAVLRSILLRVLPRKS